MSSIFNMFSKPELQQLNEKSEIIELLSSENLFEKGDIAEHIYIVKKGKVTLFRLMPNGEEKIFKVFLAGGCIAEIAVFMEPREYPMSARAEQPTQLVAHSYSSIKNILYSSPDTALNVMNFMSNRIHNLMNSIDILTQVNANQRIVMRFAELYISQKRDDNKFFLPFTKKVLASQLGITPETLSRIFHKLKVKGLIEEHGASITAPNFELLCNEVGLMPSIFTTD